MQITFPAPPSGSMGDYLGRAFQQLQQALSSAVSSNETAARIVLSSPSGKTFAITVSDAGTLSATPIGTNG